MNKKTPVIIIALIVVLSLFTSVVAYGGDFDTPILPLNPTKNSNVETGSENGDDTTTTTTTSTTTTTTTKKATTTTKAAAPKKTSIKSLTKGKGSITVKWKKVGGITGYQIKYSTNKKFKKGKNTKTVTVKGAKNKKKAVKVIKAGKKHYFRIRTYKTVKGKPKYSAWSKTVTIKL